MDGFSNYMFYNLLLVAPIPTDYRYRIWYPEYDNNPFSWYYLHTRNILEE